MKLCREMVEAMGGADSEHYRHFKMLCCEAYNILRKSASLILSLFHLMSGAAIPDIHPDPEKAMLKLQVRLCKFRPLQSIVVKHKHSHRQGLIASRVLLLLSVKAS